MERLQAAFRCLGYLLPRSTRPDGTLDGIFGGEVAEVVQAFELVVDLESTSRSAGRAAVDVERRSSPDFLLGHAMAAAGLVPLIKALIYWLVVAVGLIILIYLVEEALPTVVDRIRARVQDAINELTALRRAVEALPAIELAACGPQYDRLIDVINTIVTRLQSPVAKRPNRTFLRNLERLLQDLEDALNALSVCLPGGLVEAGVEVARDLVNDLRRRLGLVKKPGP